MERWKIVNAIGAILVLIGVWLSIGAIMPDGPDTSTMDIPPGMFYKMYTTSALSGASVSGSYHIEPGTADFYVFNEAQYQGFYQYGFVDEYIYHDSGHENDFEVALSGTDTFYIVVLNTDADSTITQELQITSTWNGLSWSQLSIGIVLIIVAVVLTIYGLKLKGEADKEREEGLEIVRVDGAEPSDAVSPNAEGDPPAPPPVTQSAEVQIPRTRTVKRPPQQPI